MGQQKLLELTGAPRIPNRWTHTQSVGQNETTDHARNTKTNANRKVTTPRKKQEGGEEEKRKQGEKVEAENDQRWRYTVTDQISYP